MIITSLEAFETVTNQGGLALDDAAAVLAAHGQGSLTRRTTRMKGGLASRPIAFPVHLALIAIWILELDRPQSVSEQSSVRAIP